MSKRYKIFVMDNLKPPYLNKLTIQEPLKGNEIHIQISGHWPTPNWSHHKTEIKYEETNQSIIIHYLGKSKSGMALQVLHPFSDIIVISPPSKGLWKIKLKGRSKTLTHSLEV